MVVEMFVCLVVECIVVMIEAGVGFVMMHGDCYYRKLELEGEFA